MKEDTTEIKGETVKKTVTPNLEKRVTRLEALMRKAGKVMEQHFGIDIDGDGKVGSVRVACLLVILFSAICFATTTIVDWSTGVSGTIGTAKITSDGTNATLTVDKIAAGTMAQSNTVVQGTTTLNGAVTVSSGGETITAGNLTMTAGTVVVDRVTAKSTSFAYASIADLPKNTFTFFDDFFTITAYTNAETMDAFCDWHYTGDGGDNTDLTIGAAAGGVLKLVTGSTDNNEAYIQFGRLGTEGLFCIESNSTKKLTFEARVRAPVPGSEGGVFVGLADPGSSAANFLVDDSGILNTNKNFIGFWMGTSSSNNWWNFVANCADAAAMVQDVYIITNTVSTYVRLGFTFDGVRTTTVYTNGGAKARVHTNNAVSYPNATNMAPIIASKTGDNYSLTNDYDYVYIQEDR